MSSRNSLPRVPVIDFYRRRVLPALYERLDEVFPEFGWVRDPDGTRWRATREFFTRETFNAPAYRVEVFERTAFAFNVCDSQGMVSWTSYINAGRASTAWDVVEAVQTLAGRLRLVERLDRIISPEDQAQRRRRELLEALLGQCCQRLHLDRALRHEVTSRHGFSPVVLRRGAAMGYLDRPADIARWLHTLGFSQDEIDDTPPLKDPAWRKRLIIPWRNRWGAIIDLLGVGLDPDAPRLTLTGAAPSFMGHDVALRHGLDHQELIIVEGDLEALWMHAMGWPRTLGLAGQPLNASRWHALTRCGVQRVALILDQTEDHGQTLYDTLQARMDADGPLARVIPLDAPGQTLGQVMRDARGLPEDLEDALRKA